MLPIVVIDGETDRPAAVRCARQEREIRGGIATTREENDSAERKGIVGIRRDTRRVC